MSRPLDVHKLGDSTGQYSRLGWIDEAAREAVSFSAVCRYESIITEQGEPLHYTR